MKKRTCDEKRGDKGTWGIDTGRVTEGEGGGRSEVENGCERGTKGPAKRVTKRAEAEGGRRRDQEG